MSVALQRDINTAYAFFERNWNLTRRYFGWEVVWFVYSLVSALTILFIASATERITGQSVDTTISCCICSSEPRCGATCRRCSTSSPKPSPGNAGKARSSTR